MSRYLQGYRYKEIAAHHEAIVRGILREQNITFDQLPAATRTALTYATPQIRNAARLAFASGCLITGITVAEGGYTIELKPPHLGIPLSFKTKTTSCEAEMHGKLKECGLRPPGRQLVEAFFKQFRL